MLDFLRRFAPRQKPPPPLPLPKRPPLLPTVMIEGLGAVDLIPHLMRSGNFLFADWDAIEATLAPLPTPQTRSAGWAAFQQAWLEHLAHMLGPYYHVAVSDHALVLSSLEANVARASLKYLETTRGRLVNGILKGIAAPPQRGKSVLMVLNTQEEYYEYVSHYYPGDGEFAVSGGMFINVGGGHFLTLLDDLSVIESTIAHELTHSCLAHLPIPAWLNEGIAVNTESRLVQTSATYGYPQQMHRRMQAYWNPERIQAFWTGSAYLQADAGCELSYTLGRVMVEQLGRDWASFQAFATQAHLRDAGQAAAMLCLGTTLGAIVCALLEQDYSAEWEPDPASWQGEPEKGAF
ncbi:hypothetical protein [Solimonas sp. K1W22B-7]|uniref:hypothetical protein n=1 Tax=Solimonas sp. K1W22B-7 TaxID=2303331 RepID=UPI0013C4BA19|nr:hypothetical protein [Solimonas sp. K1W22B-7]